MLDINLFRDEKSFKKILESEKKRFKSLEFAENTKKFDSLWREAKKNEETLRAEKNKLNKQIPVFIKDGKDISKLKKESKELDLKIKEMQEKQKKYFTLRDENRYKVGNILFDDVPVAEDETGNTPIWFWGKAKIQKPHLEEFKKESLKKMDFEFIDFKPISHADFGVENGLFDLERASKVSGARFYYLKNRFAILHFSLLRFAMDKMMEKGYNLLYTPFIMNAEIIKKAAELGDFEETLYKVGKDQFLIATAEQTIASYHMDEILEQKDLPLKYVGFSSAFRREAGSRGKDTRGIFRVHQFDKVEQYVFCLPDQSEKIHKEMIKNTEEIMQALEIPYRVINICSGDMNDTAAKKYDIELWMPVQGKFREIASGSITTDYQTRKLNVRYRKGNDLAFVHSLNCTALPSPRILAAIIENHQTKDGKIKIPKALWKYTGFKEI